MSEIKVNSVVNSTGDNDSGLDLSTNDQVIIKTANTTAVTVDSSQGVTVAGAFTSRGIDDNADATAITIDSSENVKVGGIETDQTSPLMVKTNSSKYAIYLEENSGQESWQIGVSPNGDLDFRNSGGTDPAIKFNDSGELLIGSVVNTPAQSNTAGAFSYRPTGQLEVSSNNTQCAFFNRTTDGTLIQFLHEGSSEGNIGISGSTVNYTGGHLSRWSRLVGGGQPNTLLRGTVMSNLDDMVVWSHEEVLWTNEDELPDGVSVGDVKKSAYTEDNEQLNHTKVSDVEGDVNVAGVFQSWDSDDDFDDYYLAMTGDFVIRIAKGTTVARGDLLMSAGDGTAKPQDDDIVRSKTIAKVTSTNVSHTYDDGTYLVPCVLMAC